MFGYRNRIVQEDLASIASRAELFESLKGSTVMVTGATGMLATYVTFLLMHLRPLDIKVVALCRTASKADALFGPFYKDSNFRLLLQDIRTPIGYQERADYIFHLAGNASPHFINSDPAGIMESNVTGTWNVIQFARSCGTQKIIFASTREVYGKAEGHELLSEGDFGAVDPLEDRSCYPESKRAAEALLKSYFLQYGVNFNSVRIAHAYGPGMRLSDDGRVMSDLMSDAVSGRDIVLKSDGSAVRAFCYITDAVLGMFHVLCRGDAGAAYNIANETEPVSVRKLAEMLTEARPDLNLSVAINMQGSVLKGYCGYERIGLDTSRLEQLGWRPAVPLHDGIRRTVQSFLI